MQLSCKTELGSCLSPMQDGHALFVSSMFRLEFGSDLDPTAIVSMKAVQFNTYSAMCKLS